MSVDKRTGRFTAPHANLSMRTVALLHSASTLCYAVPVVSLPAALTPLPTPHSLTLSHSYSHTLPLITQAPGFLGSDVFHYDSTTAARVDPSTPHYNPEHVVLFRFGESHAVPLGRGLA